MVHQDCYMSTRQVPRLLRPLLLKGPNTICFIRKMLKLELKNEK